MKPWGWIAIVAIVVALLTLGGIALGMRVLGATKAPVSDVQLPNGNADRQTLDGNGVSIQVTPLELGRGETRAAFDVTLNTHSVDLSYDLADLATLRLDNGTEVVASEWTGGLGGHHVAGRLTFPAPDLEDVQSVELVVREVAGVPTWSFTWSLP
jgi:hypothetical protein